MIDLTNITLEEANKIECALLQMENDFTEKMQSWAQLSTDTTFSEKARETFRSNAQWWSEVHKLIYGIDNITKV